MTFNGCFSYKKDAMIFLELFLKAESARPGTDSCAATLVYISVCGGKSFTPFHLVLSSFSHRLSNHYHSFHVSMPFSLMYCWQDLWISPKGLKRYIKVIGKVQLLHQTVIVWNGGFWFCDVQVFPISGSVIHSSKRSTHGSPTHRIGLTKPIRARFRRFMAILAHRHQLLHFSLQQIWNTDTSSRVKNLPKHTRFGESWEFWTIKGDVKGSTLPFRSGVDGKAALSPWSTACYCPTCKRDNPCPQLTLTLAANHHKGLRSSEVQELAPRRVYGPPAPALSGYIGKRSVD